MIVNDLVVVKLFTYCSDQLGVNVLHYQCTLASAGNTYTGNDVGSKLAVNGVGLAYRDCMSADAEYVGVEGANLLPFPGPGFIVRSQAGVGSEPSVAMSRQVSGIITKQTAGVGRSKRGRMYVAFPSEGFNTVNGIPTDPYVVALDALAAIVFANILLTSHAGESATLVPVVRSFLGGVTTTATITNWISRKKWANQRRRGSYGRPNVRP